MKEIHSLQVVPNAQKVDVLDIASASEDLRMHLDAFLYLLEVYGVSETNVVGSEVKGNKGDE